MPTSNEKRSAPYAGEIAIADDSIYSHTNFGKYNPDDLYGIKGFKIYRNMMKDEQVKAVVQFKRDAITSRDYIFEVDNLLLEEGIISEEEVARRISVFNAIIDNMQGSFLDTINSIMTGMYNGFSMTEKIYNIFTHTDKQSYIGIDKLKLRPFDSFIFKIDKYDNILEVVQRISTGAENKINPKKFIHYVHNPSIDVHYGGSDLREAYRAWFSKDHVIKFQNIFLERMAGGFVVLSPEIESDLDIRQGSPIYNQLVNVLDRMKTSPGILLPKGIGVEIHYPTGSANPYGDAIAQYDKAIAKALLVPNLLGISEQGQVGSYSQSQTQLEAFLWTLDAAASRLEEALNEQLFRELGMLNFSDGIYPRFKFKPVSEEVKHKIIDIWKNLVSGKAVTPSESDEEHLRILLGFPAKKFNAGDDDEDNKEGVVDPTTALNGQQVQSMLEIVSKVAQGQIPRDTGVQMMASAFPLSVKQAEKIMGQVGQGFVPKNAGVAPNEENQTSSENDTGTGDTEGSGNDTDNGGDNTDSENDGAVNETIAGKMVNTTAFMRAVNRVDFAVIDQKTQALDLAKSSKIRDTMNKFVVGMLDKLPNDGITPELVKTLTVGSNIKRQFKNVFKSQLQEGWALGTTTARNEITKAAAGAPKFKKICMAARAYLNEEAADAFLESRSLDMSTVITENVRKKVTNVIFNGIKNSWTSDEIVRRVMELIQIDFINEVNTIVRTNIFEAVNEARYNFFRSEEVGDFVEALLYSAILDGRTTHICRHLDGKIYAIDSDVWQTYTPPNHFNCRSLIVPVTAIDSWNSSKAPKVEPQQGF